jgi:hypothetical protein
VVLVKKQVQSEESRYILLIDSIVSFYINRKIGKSLSNYNQVTRLCGLDLLICKGKSETTSVANYRRCRFKKKCPIFSTLW